MNACKEINQTKLLELVERDKPAAPKNGKCPVCEYTQKEIYNWQGDATLPRFCWNCGQRLDWGNAI